MAQKSQGSAPLSNLHSPISTLQSPLSLYIHVPFCASKCKYCDFYSLAAPERMDDYVNAMCRHLDAWGERCREYRVDTVYFGGGTPSLLGGARLTRLLGAAARAFSVEENAEITVECNPDSMDAALLAALRGAGVNRLSVGVQSAHDGELRMLGRRHTFEEARRAVGEAYRYGFENLSLDLMYALPGQDEPRLLESVQALLALAPAHLSCYALKVEPGTPFARERIVQPDEDVQADMYLALCGMLSAAGYEHYEISNWAKPGFRAKHNAKYWDLSPYLGIGPSAHSLLDGRRFAYDRSLDAFLAGQPPVQEDEVDGFSPALEFLMLALRTADGVVPEAFEARFGVSFMPFARRLRFFEPHGLTRFENGRWRLTEQGFLLSNSILTDVLSAE
ncbi:MAG: radical SAM family heme chaperone HemW [Clostridiaceae bacterium]|nr:radical SAM family heme chaperone HemW [Clostridiaceae bacterium]